MAPLCVSLSPPLQMDPNPVPLAGIRVKQVNPVARGPTPSSGTRAAAADLQ
jgi:hypothetical protein